MVQVPPAIKRAVETLVADAKILNELMGWKVGGSKALPRSPGRDRHACLTNQRSSGMKVKRDQKDDRQWKADQPNQGVPYKSHRDLSWKSNHPLPVSFRFPSSPCVSAGPASCAAVPRARAVSPTSGFIGWPVTTTASIVLARCHASRTVATVVLFA
jgi:hypothetical protein